MPRVLRLQKSHFKFQSVFVSHNPIFDLAEKYDLQVEVAITPIRPHSEAKTMRPRHDRHTKYIIVARRRSLVYEGAPARRSLSSKLSVAICTQAIGCDLHAGTHLRLSVKPTLRREFSLASSSSSFCVCGLVTCEAEGLPPATLSIGSRG